jgi:hypothetical protein
MPAVDELVRLQHGTADGSQIQDRLSLDVKLHQLLRSLERIVTNNNNNNNNNNPIPLLEC